MAVMKPQNYHGCETFLQLSNNIGLSVDLVSTYIFFIIHSFLTLYYFKIYTNM